MKQMKNIKIDQEDLNKVDHELDKLKVKQDMELKSMVEKEAVSLCLLHIHAKLKEINDYLERE